MKSIFGAMMAILVMAGAHAKDFTRPPVWTIDALVGLAPNFDGPSCYTAAMLGLGYVDNVAFVGAKEVEYYIANFCAQRADGATPLAGDLLALTDIGGAYNNHLAIYMGDGKVFEKENGNGAIESYMDFDPHFFLRSMSESRWFKNYQAAGQQLKVYRCQGAKEMRQKVAKCESRADALGMADLRREQERMTFSSPSKFEFGHASVLTVERLAEEMRTISESDPCFEYMVAVGEELVMFFKVSRQQRLQSLPNSVEFLKAREVLDGVMWNRFGI